MLIATLIAPQHLSPVQPLGLALCAGFIGTSFISLHGYKTDAGGMLAASSGLYTVLAMRRRFRIRDRFGPRGILRGVTLGLCMVDFVCGVLVFAGKEEEGDLRIRTREKITESEGKSGKT
jgi:hypothetical protein